MNTLGEIISAEIRSGGPMSFERFMGLALYHPEFGYYERNEATVGKAGDFYTSVAVGGLFGELLAFQFAEWLDQIGGDGSFQIVEAGAHDGRLARDVLGWLRAFRPELIKGIEYWIIEPSPRRCERQGRILADFGDRVRWFADWETCPGQVNGVIFANELLDAFPIRRFAWDAVGRKWFEWGVGVDGSGLCLVRLPVTGEGYRPPQGEFITSELESVLPDGFIFESCPQSAKWWTRAAAALRKGHLMTFDYGLAAEELVIPERAGGTLRGYREHRVMEDVLANPGEQDLTAHVNFAAIQAAGEAAGLKTKGLHAQGRFLAEIAQRAMKPEARFGEWTQARVRQFQTLTHPEHLGRAFRVLHQTTAL